MTHPAPPGPAPVSERLSDLLRQCDWPETGIFQFVDEPGEHEPCYVVMPGGSMLALNHHDGPGVDIARAKFIVEACNAALREALLAAEERDHA